MKCILVVHKCIMYWDGIKNLLVFLFVYKIFISFAHMLTYKYIERDSVGVFILLLEEGSGGDGAF